MIAGAGAGAGAGKPDLVRLHPALGGQKVNFAGQCFIGASPDVFINLDKYNPARVYRVTRKVNLTIGINPDAWSTEDFFRYFTRGQRADGTLVDPFRTGALRAEEKCAIHGDKESRLFPSIVLKIFLEYGRLDKSFKVGDAVYMFDSIGVAANRKFEAVDHRAGNPFNSTGSHFEIKFKRISDPVLGGPVEEYVCLNLHLSADSRWDQEAVKKRLQAAVRLFSAELGVRKPDNYRPETRLRDSFEVTLYNYADYGFLCRHELSRQALQRYLDAQAAAPAGAVVVAPVVPLIRAPVVRVAPGVGVAPGVRVGGPLVFAPAVFAENTGLQASDFPALGRK